MDNVTLTLTREEAQLLLNGLTTAPLPYIQTAPLVGKIMQQANPSQAVPETPVEDEEDLLMNGEIPALAKGLTKDRSAHKS